MANTFKLLEEIPNDITVGNGVIINQYPDKLWLADKLLSLPIEYI